MVRETEHPHIVSDTELHDEPVIRDTKTRVRAIVELWRIGVKPEDIPEHLPHITLAQVFDALSYYNDHPEEMDRFIEMNRVRDDEVHPSAR